MYHLSPEGKGPLVADKDIVTYKLGLVPDSNSNRERIFVSPYSLFTYFKGTGYSTEIKMTIHPMHNIYMDRGFFSVLSPEYLRVWLGTLPVNEEFTEEYSLRIGEFTVPYNAGYYQDRNIIISDTLIYNRLSPVDITNMTKIWKKEP